MSDSENPPSEASSTANALDLRFLPSWLKEDNSAPVNYANFDGEDRGPRGDGGNRRERGGQDFQRRPRPAGGGGSGRNDRGPQRSSSAPNSGPRPPRPSGPPQSGGRAAENRGPRRDGGRPEQGRSNGPGERRQQRPAPQEERPPNVNVTFLPEEHALEKVIEQLKSAPIAYPLFGVAKMFLQRPERHHIVIKPLPGVLLFRLADTAHLSTDRSRLEAIAFQELWRQFFRVEVTETAEIKGNFASVARSRLTGRVFGPTSHHSYQPAIHKEYEERFSRRMSFQEYKSNIETTNNPEAIEQWKTESRRVEVYHLRTASEAAEISLEQPASEESDISAQADVITEDGEVAVEPPKNEDTSSVTESTAIAEEPATPKPTTDAESEMPVNSASDETTNSAEKTFPTKAEAEAYFRQEILPALITETEAITLTGPEARNLQDRQLASAVRIGWETEMRYPLGLVNAIRVKFNEQNLHIFKFKRRVLLISSLKPFYLDDRSESLSTSIRTVLQTIHAQPGIDRKGLAQKILGQNAATEDEKLSLKHSLIGDLYWLIRQGNVIEFSDGTFDLPMGPKALQAEVAEAAQASQPVAQQEDILPLAAVAGESSAETQEQ